MLSGCFWGGEEEGEMWLLVAGEGEMWLVGAVSLTMNGLGAWRFSTFTYSYIQRRGFWLMNT